MNVVYYMYMRLVLIVQSLIILAGAYYVYTLSRPTPTEPVGENSAPPSEIQIQVESTAGTDEQANEPAPEPAAGEVIITEGHNDLGMEFPIPDEGVLEVR